MEKLVVFFFVLSASLSVFAVSDSGVVVSTTDNSTSARLIKGGNQFSLIASGTFDTVSWAVFDVPQDGDEWNASLLSVIGYVRRDTAAVTRAYVYAMILISQKITTKTPSISYTDTLWRFEFSKDQGLVKKLFVTATNSISGPGYSSQEKISEVKFFSAPDFFFIGVYKNSSAEQGSYGSSSASAIFLYDGGKKNEYDVYLSSSSPERYGHRYVESVSFDGPHDYDLMSGDFTVHISTDTGLVDFNGNLFHQETKISPKAIKASLQKSFPPNVFYNMMGRRSNNTNRAAVGLRIVPAPNGMVRVIDLFR